MQMNLNKTNGCQGVVEQLWLKLILILFKRAVFIVADFVFKLAIFLF